MLHIKCYTLHVTHCILHILSYPILPDAFYVTYSLGARDTLHEVYALDLPSDLYALNTQYALYGARTRAFTANLMH